jgi:hypothetical protein
MLPLALPVPSARRSALAFRARLFRSKVLIPTKR